MRWSKSPNSNEEEPNRSPTKGIVASPNTGKENMAYGIDFW